MSSDTKAIIGTIVATGVAIAGLMSAQIAGVNTRIDDLDASVNARIEDLDASVNARIEDLDASVNARMDRIEARMDRIEARLDGLDERLRNVEIAFGKVDQRLLTLERVILPPQPPGDE